MWYSGRWYLAVGDFVVQLQFVPELRENFGSWCASVLFRKNSASYKCLLDNFFPDFENSHKPLRSSDSPAYFLAINKSELYAKSNGVKVWGGGILYQGGDPREIYPLPTSWELVSDHGGVVVQGDPFNLLELSVELIHSQKSHDAPETIVEIYACHRLFRLHHLVAAVDSVMEGLATVTHQNLRTRRAWRNKPAGVRQKAELEKYLSPSLLSALTRGQARVLITLSSVGIALTDEKVKSSYRHSDTNRRISMPDLEEDVHEFDSEFVFIQRGPLPPPDPQLYPDSFTD